MVLVDGGDEAWQDLSQSSLSAQQGSVSVQLQRPSGRGDTSLGCPSGATYLSLYGDDNNEIVLARKGAALSLAAKVGSSRAKQVAGDELANPLEDGQRHRVRLAYSLPGPPPSGSIDLFIDGASTALLHLAPTSTLTHIPSELYLGQRSAGVEHYDVWGDHRGAQVD